MIKICERCGKAFNTRYQSKYCSKKCRKEAAKERREIESQPCWRCQKACGECSWSKNLTPVDGWEAEFVTVISDGVKEYSTFRIIKCPMFMADER